MSKRMLAANTSIMIKINSVRDYLPTLLKDRLAESPD